MADDKLKTGPESPVLDHPGGGPAGDAQAVTKPPVPEEVEGPAAGTGPAPQPEQSVIPGMGKDAPAQPAPQVEAEKTGKSLNQDKKVEPEEKTAKRRGRPPKEQDHPQGGKAEKGPEPRKGRIIDEYPLATFFLAVMVTCTEPLRLSTLMSASFSAASSATSPLMQCRRVALRLPIRAFLLVS